mmetsp:Transcript_6529/g.9052  ORF Transcript_6529/g.9052 Transcript_6529/m.9052 type:complete len:80 (+) Transcript_6529:484-723(+)
MLTLHDWHGCLFTKYTSSGSRKPHLEMELLEFPLWFSETPNAKLLLILNLNNELQRIFYFSFHQESTIEGFPEIYPQLS